MRYHKRLCQELLQRDGQARNGNSQRSWDESMMENIMKYSVEVVIFKYSFGLSSIFLSFQYLGRQQNNISLVTNNPAPGISV